MIYFNLLEKEGIILFLFQLYLQLYYNCNVISLLRGRFYIDRIARLTSQHNICVPFKFSPQTQVRLVSLFSKTIKKQITFNPFN